ncbi:MAG: S46 family peptidase [Prevotellaceae bacterium]|jgi:hypothetical protein|nr:S46 family peptidase [Prevotellaceae bacterium]
MKKILLYVIVATMFAPTTKADEGMWLLPLIQKLNIKDMKKAGCKLSADDIYSINSSSIKDAVVIFGGGCTGEIISPQGLLLTNHHCGYGAIQQHSSVEHDYLKHGFWAKTRSDEIPTPGLSVRFLERIENVSERIVPALDGLAENNRAAVIAQISDSIAKAATNNVSWLHAYVSSMFGGNEYWLIVYRVYSDVRLVGAPPSSIGKFGNDTDNWMWPRHTGDFSLFRVYAGKDGNPAEYSQENIPLKPKHHLPISLKGFAENDFAMILGFPGATQRYMTSWEVNERIDIGNSIRIKVRGIRQEMMREDMLADPKVNIQYATKYSGSSNYWKNSIGMNKALKRLGIVAQKQAQERSFEKWIAADNQRQTLYGQALPMIEKAVAGRRESSSANLYLAETLMRGSEILGFAASFGGLYEFLKKDTIDNTELNRHIDGLKKNADSFFKNYNMPTDRKISAAMYKLYFQDVDKQYQAGAFEKINEIYSGDFKQYTNDMFAATFLLDRERLDRFFEAPSLEILENDPAMQLERSVRKSQSSLRKANDEFSHIFSEGHRRYVAGLMSMYNGVRPVYPDANFTMRMTYGKISGYRPADAEYFDYLTTASGIIEKEDPNNWEFEVPDKLKNLIATRNFGVYALKDGRLPVCFIFNGDITGGNSGSPVLNARGELIGTAFDGNWEAMSGDIAFEHEMQRCINVDIRYTLFIIDKFADAKYLIDEMTIVK